MLEASKRFGTTIITDTDPTSLCGRINSIYHQLYRASDLYMPPIYTGAFMFRDIFYPVRIPVFYGTVILDPVSFLQDMERDQKDWLFASKESGLTYLDQAIDIFDFACGLDELEHHESLSSSMEMWRLGRRQLEVAAAAALVSFDKHAIVQNCLIACELIFKGALLTCGYEKAELKTKYGHNFKKLGTEIANSLPRVDGDRIVSVASTLPDLVANRYENENYRRIDIGRIVMTSQFIGGEIIRQFASSNMRSELTSAADDWDTSKRTFPSLTV